MPQHSVVLLRLKWKWKSSKNMKYKRKIEKACTCEQNTEMSKGRERAFLLGNLSEFTERREWNSNDTKLSSSAIYSDEKNDTYIIQGSNDKRQKLWIRKPAVNFKIDF